MNKQETLKELAQMGLEFSAADEATLLYESQQRNPFSVHTGVTADGRPFATTRRSTEAWTDNEGTTHPAVDRSSHYVYGESEAHAAALLLLQQMKVYNHSQFTLNWKYSARSKSANNVTN